MNSPVPIGRIQYTIITMQSKKQNAPKKANQRRQANGNGNGNGRPRGPIAPGRPVARPQYSREFPQKRPVAAATAYAAGQSSSAPSVTASRDSARIVHKELVVKVAGTTAYTVGSTLALNPGLASTFPWLSTQAGSWESYRFNKLRFCYHTRTATTTGGSVQLVPDYDAADAAPSSEFIAASYEDMQEDAPWKDITCELRPQAMFPMGPKKFVRTGPLSANQDIKTYDAGNFFVTTTDAAGAANWGLIWVEYDVTLFTPQAPSSGFAASQHITASTPTSAAMLPSGTISSGSTTFVAVPAAESLVFLASGRYLIQYNATATTSVTETAPPVAASGATLVTTFGLGGTGLFVAGSGTASFSSTVVVDAVVNSTLTYNNTIVAGLLAEMIISRLPPTQV